MTTAYIADTGVFVRCGGPDNDKYQQLRRAVQQANVSLLIPQRVYEELGGNPDANEYPSGDIPYPEAIEEGWVVVASALDYTNPVVATVMDGARRFIANETERTEDRIEKADTALLGLAAQLLDTEKAEMIVLLTTDKPAGQAAKTLLPNYGFRGRIEYQYVSAEYLETITAECFSQ